MGNVREINIKNWTYYFFYDMIDSKDFDSSLLKIDKRSCKNIDIYYIWYITMKDFDYVKINGVNLSYFIIDKLDGYIECNSIEKWNRNKYLTLVSKHKNKKNINKLRRSLE